MHVLIRTWVRQGGQRAARERQIETDRIRIGRGTDQDIEIADLRVSLAHAELWMPRKDAIEVEARSASGVWVNGRPRARARLKSGDNLEFGRFRIAVKLSAEGLALDLEEIPPPADRPSLSRGRPRTTLELAGLSRRRLSWLLFALVLLTGVLLPAAFRYSGHPAVRDAAPDWASDKLWHVGTSSAAHAFFSGDCAQCHQQPFVQVRDEACLACHADTHQHVDDPKLLALKDFAGDRCTQCHHEHRGTVALVAHSDSLCTDCHADPRQRFPGTRLLPAAAFSDEHPPFAPRVARFDAGSQSFSWIEARSVADQHSDTNLIFQHAVHLSSKGVLGPEGRRKLACGDCHTPDASGVSFRPIEMESQCASCHRLDFDPDDPTRRLPHGNPALVVQAIRDYYARAALDGGIVKPGAPRIVQLRRRPGETLNHDEARAALAWADAQSSQVIDEVFDRRVCRECHLIQHAQPVDSQAPAVPWQVAPVMLEAHPLRSATFSHAAHRSETCESCHAARSSEHSEDLLLPGIQRCRDCHGQKTAALNAAQHVESTCADCHAFHQANHALMGPAQTAVRPLAAATKAAASIPSGSLR